jgi:carboxymethylenebutenolidase
MDPRMLALYDEFTHAPLPRREFVARLAKLVGGVSAALALLPALENDYARAAVVGQDDPRVEAGLVQIPAPAGPVRTYQARPRGEGRRPGVVVIHENRGLNPYVEDVTRRLAVAGFLALAPDALSARGGTPADPDRAREWIGELDEADARALYLAAVEHARGHEAGTGRVGCVGFCWGGGMAGQLAVHAPALAVAVVFYGRPPASADVPRIRAALQLHYAGQDERINAGVPGFEAALRAAGVAYELHRYEGAQHAFHNDTSPARYDAAAAALAWQRTLDFLGRTLGPAPA